MGFVLTKGQFITIDVPFVESSYAQANDINSKGSIVGTWVDADCVPHGFLAKASKAHQYRIFGFSGYHGVGH
jgi:hypothetical protein